MNRRNARGNRAGLFWTGLVLLAAGAAALARGLSLRPALLGAAHTPLTDAFLRRYAHAHAWFWPAAAAIAVIIALLALRWLAIQARTGAISRISLESSHRRGTTYLSATAATAAIEKDLAASPDLRHPHAALTGSPRNPRLNLAITLDPDADPGPARQHTDQAITRLRDTLENPQLTATVKITAR